MASNALSGPAARLSHKTILITGASAGIGRATALEFARSGAQGLKLILAARRLEALHELARDIGALASTARCLPLRLDVSDEAAVQAAVAALPAEFRGVDVLVNNACALPHTASVRLLMLPRCSGLVKGVARAPDIAAPDIATMVSTNFTGLVALTQALLPTFLARRAADDGSTAGTGTGTGTIVNIGSIAGRDPYAGGSIYCATKAAVRAFTDALRHELTHTRIRVVEIDPGQVETEFSVVRFGGDVQRANDVYKGCEPLTGEDVAEAIVFAVGRRENVVIADMLVLPNHQARCSVPVSLR